MGGCSKALTDGIAVLVSLLGCCLAPLRGRAETADGFTYLDDDIYGEDFDVVPLPRTVISDSNVEEQQRAVEYGY
jgi:hypothetical protein